MSDWREDDLDSFEGELERRELSPEGIAETNRHLVERQALFRRAADVATSALAGFHEVMAVALFGSVGTPLWKEVPRFRSYRRAGTALWHECADVDIAVWLNRLDRLREMRRKVNRALPVILEDTGHGVASHQLDIFLLEPGTNRYLGRMCQFKACPADKAECLVPGCGATSFLQQHQGFVLQPDALGPARAVKLFDRTSGESRRAVDLPGPPEDETQ
ncbi:MAG: hypothetical protein V3S40_14300 [Kiloniellales bacterium]